MKRLIHSALCIALCSIAAIATCNAENKFKPVKSLPKGEKAHRWQQQLKWGVDAYAIVFPELKLVGWREAGTLSNQSEVDNFLKEGVAMDRMYGYTIYDENRRPKPETKRYIPCDTLLLSVGLLPENELDNFENFDYTIINRQNEFDEFFKTHQTFNVFVFMEKYPYITNVMEIFSDEEQWYIILDPLEGAYSYKVYPLSDELAKEICEFYGIAYE